jgi:hypothetical protein
MAASKAKPHLRSTRNSSFAPARHLAARLKGPRFLGPDCLLNDFDLKAGRFLGLLLRALIGFWLLEFRSDDPQKGVFRHDAVCD